MLANSFGDPVFCFRIRLGGDKTGDKRWYEVNVPIADRLYDEHLKMKRLNEERIETAGKGLGASDLVG